jgi:peptide/nickel transport system substrate-binding protein
MTKFKHVVAGVAAIALVTALAAWGSKSTVGSGHARGTGAAGGRSLASALASDKSGGVLKVALLNDAAGGMDPSREYYGPAWAVLRAMTRSLLAFPQAPAPIGNEVIPDLASSLPRVSADKLTYTLHIRKGVRFSPPVSRAITCADFKYAFERMFSKAGTGGYNFYYSVIKGAPQLAAGKAKHLSGVTCPNASTIMFKLTEPTGDFPFRLAMPATAPIPNGIAAGHDKDYGRYLVSSGPYMWAGEDAESFAHHKPAAGYQPTRSMLLVRNPNWQRSTDPVHKAYVDRISVTIGGTSGDLVNKVRAGDVDVLGDTSAAPAEAQPFRTDPSLKQQLQSYGADFTLFAYMNTKIPPFDDVHVRKAVNWAVNRDALVRLYGGSIAAAPATHVVPPSMAGALPGSFDPYATPNHTGSLQKAKAEMKRSKYDKNHDGVCDAGACKNLYEVAITGAPYPQMLESLNHDLGSIGLTFRSQSVDRGTAFASLYSTPSKGVAFGATYIWGKDYPSALTFIDPLFNGKNIKSQGNVNVAQINDPTLNAKIAHCKTLSQQQQGSCWADADKYLTTNLAPVADLIWGKQVMVFSKRTNFVFDQFSGWPAYTSISLK